MTRAIRNEFEPDLVLRPGLTLQETLVEFGMSQSELATRTGRPQKTINEIINGKSAITPETAIQLERVLGVPARVWNSLERHYREYLARVEDGQRLEASSAWLDAPPRPRYGEVRLDRSPHKPGRSSASSARVLWDRVAAAVERVVPAGSLPERKSV